MRGSRCGGDVVPLRQSAAVPDTELLSCRDFSQHAVENLEKGTRRRELTEVSQIKRGRGGRGVLTLASEF